MDCIAYTYSETLCGIVHEGTWRTSDFSTDKTEDSPYIHTLRRNVKCENCLARLDGLMEAGLAWVVPGWDNCPPEGYWYKLVIAPIEPEYRSIQAFLQFLEENESDTYSHEDLTALREYLRKSAHDIKYELLQKDKKLSIRGIEKRVRGISSNDHDRWYGPGASKTHGGGSGF